MTVRTRTYFSEGAVIVADLYTPDNIIEGRKYPAIGICQGFTGIRTTPTMEGLGKALRISKAKDVLKEAAQIKRKFNEIFQ